MLNNEIIFSLILATIGRSREVDEFLRSIFDQEFNINNIEIIIVDQNIDNNLDCIVKKYLDLGLNLNHIKSNLKGVSSNRNLGIQLSRGLILGFPDDDCTYYKNTLKVVYDLFDSDADIDFLLGRVYNRSLGKKVIRNWPEKNKVITKYNFFFLYSMITVFTKRPVFFDENFGGGSTFPAYEDADYVHELIKNGYEGLYSAEIDVWHPQLNINSMSNQKINNYGFGFGAFCKKSKSFYFFFLLALSILRHIFGLFWSILFFNYLNIRKRFISIKSRLYGWLQYSSIKKY